MVTKSNDPLTEAELAKYNAAITDFVKKNSDFVDYAELDDGNTYITLRYGSIRSSVASALREIANRCRTSLIDDQFKIGDLSCTIVFANTSILRFSGKTNVIHSELKELESNGTSPLNTLIVASKVNVEMLPDEDIASFAADLKTLSSAGQGRDYDPTLTEKSKKDVGVTFSNYGGKEHVSFSLKKIMSSELAETEFGKTLSWITKTYSEVPKMITVTLSEKLAALHVYLERINENTIMLAYDYIGETKNQGGQGSQDEFTYTPTPGRITKIIVHYTPLENMIEDDNGANGSSKTLPVSNVTVDDFVAEPFVRKYDDNESGTTKYCGSVAVKTKDGITVGYQTLDRATDLGSPDAEFTITNEEKQAIINNLINGIRRLSSTNKVILNIGNIGADEEGYCASTSIENDDLAGIINYVICSCDNDEIQRILHQYARDVAFCISGEDYENWKQNHNSRINNPGNNQFEIDCTGAMCLGSESGLVTVAYDGSHVIGLNYINDISAYTTLNEQGRWNSNNDPDFVDDSLDGHLGSPSIAELKKYTEIGGKWYSSIQDVMNDNDTYSSITYDYNLNIIQAALKTGKALDVYLTAAYYTDDHVPNQNDD